jgi:hypothetical protein
MRALHDYSTKETMFILAAQVVYPSFRKFQTLVQICACHSERSEESLKPVLLPPNRLRKPAIVLGISHPCGVRTDSLERWMNHEIPE